MIGIPYMGSKRQLAREIVSFLISENPDATHFYDLFGGGGAVSFAALRTGKLSVHYNELNKAIVSLLQKIRDDGVTDEFYQWISREKFFRLIKGDDWMAGLAMTCWSFGNNPQKGYLYGKDVEFVKKAMHDVIINGTYKDAARLVDVTGLNCPPRIYSRADTLDLIFDESINDRRLRFIRWMENATKERCHIQHLERIQHLHRIDAKSNSSSLCITCGSYNAVEIQQPAIIYCDPPYAGTEKYKAQLDHEAFYEWLRNSPHKVYVSSYEMPDGFKCVWQKDHRSSLSATNNSKKVVERIFVNR